MERKRVASGGRHTAYHCGKGKLIVQGKDPLQRKGQVWQSKKKTTSINGDKSKRRIATGKSQHVFREEETKDVSN